MKTIETVLPALSTTEGAGFVVHRPFPVPGLSQLDPFLLIDEMGPKKTAPGEAKGAPDHPHRGFETITYMLEGEFEHKDSAGHAGKIAAGDVQWMTAGRGVVHSEMPSAEFQKTGGTMHGFQIWLNLAAKDKMIPPRYQEIPAARIPEAEIAAGAGKVRLIAGELFGMKAPIETRTPALYLDVELKSGAKAELPLPTGLTTLAYVFKGDADFMGRQAIAHQLVVFSREGSRITVQAFDAGVRFLLLAGQPLNEPVARYGPFVMNTKQEIVQAFVDFEEGRMGQIGGSNV